MSCHKVFRKVFHLKTLGSISWYHSSLYHWCLFLFNKWPCIFMITPCFSMCLYMFFLNLEFSCSISVCFLDPCLTMNMEREVTKSQSKSRHSPVMNLSFSVSKGVWKASQKVKCILKSSCNRQGFTNMKDFFIKLCLSKATCSSTKLRKEDLPDCLDTWFCATNLTCLTHWRFFNFRLE